MEYLNTKDTSLLFALCESLTSLPDISNWNTSNINEMGNLFYQCNSLISLPNISKWNVENVNDMSYMFGGCSSLISLPDISKWNMSNIKNINYMLYECISLISLPYISRWNLSSDIQFDNIYGRSNYLKAPSDISKTSTKKINNDNLLLPDNAIIKHNKLRIFGNKFVNNNKDKYKIIYYNKEYELKEYFE